MKIRVFFDKKNYLEVNDILSFQYAKEVFWYIDNRGLSHEINNVVGICSI